MPRAIWSGTLTFGLVTIPVKLYSAVQRKSVRFHQLDGDDHARIQQRRVNSVTGDEVPFDRIVKGYEVTPDRYVVVTPEELESLDPKRTRQIEIEDFVDAAEIDPIMYDTTYYLAPATGGAKPYRLLVEAMRSSGKVGVARIVLRTKEYLVALRPTEDALEMTTMIFADEIVPAASLEELEAVAETTTNAREVEIAEQLIGSLAAEWDPERYRDEYRDRVLNLVERKASGEEIEVVAAPEPEAAPVPDLMSALKASLDAVRAEQDGGEPAPSPRKAPARRKTTAAKKASPAKKPPAKAATAKRPAAKAKASPAAKRGSSRSRS